ncbi:MAG: hypothetical protein LUD83_07725 [Clostridiales bacterium]|nr:hypothetical protein [Clostridiales bacterium]
MADRKRTTAQMANTSFGNAAYDLTNTVVAPRRKERQAPRTQPEPKRQSGRKAAAQPQVRPQQGISLFAVTGFTAIALMAVLVLTSYIQLNSVYAATNTMEDYLTELVEEEASLTSEYNDLFDTATLQEVAEEAGLVEPTSSQKVYLELTEPDNAIVYEQKEDPTLVESVAEDLQSFWRSVLTYFAR